MIKFFVFTYANRDVRKGTGLVGWRDSFSFDSRGEAEDRRKDLEASPPPEQKGKTLRRIIKTEEWS